MELREELYARISAAVPTMAAPTVSRITSTLVDDLKMTSIAQLTFVRDTDLDSVISVLEARALIAALAGKQLIDIGGEGERGRHSHPTFENMYNIWPKFGLYVSVFSGTTFIFFSKDGTMDKIEWNMTVKVKTIRMIVSLERAHLFF